MKEAAHLLLARDFGLPKYRDLAREAERSSGWVTKNVGPLVTAGVVEAKPLRFGRACGCALGIAVGTESLRAALVDANGRVHHHFEAPGLPDQLGLSKNKLLARIGQAAAEVLERGLRDRTLRLQRGRLPVLGVTVAWPTPVDRDFFRAGKPLRDRAWGDEPLAAPVAQMLRGPFARKNFSHAMNDANAAVIALAYDESVARIGEKGGDRSQILMALRLSGGIGAGTMELTPHREKRLSFLDASLIVGTSGFAGEIGHLPVSHSVVKAVQEFSASAGTQPTPGLATINLTRRCSCGAVGGAVELDDIGAGGHLEAVAGAGALTDRLRASGYDVAAGRPVGKQVGKLLQRKDDEIARALWECGALIGRAMAAPILMLDPAKIMLTGFLAREQVAKGFIAIRGRSVRSVTNTVKVEVRREDDYLEVRGAALATLREQCWRQIEVDPLTLPRRAFAWTSRHQTELEARATKLKG